MRTRSQRCGATTASCTFRSRFLPAPIAASTSAVAVVGVANVLVVNRSMPDDLAHDITRVLFEKKAELAAIHPEAAHLSLERGSAGSPAPYHPGALRFYTEQKAR